MNAATPHQIYQYSPLDDAFRDIRLVSLLPGAFGDDICLEVFHTAIPTQDRVNSRMSLQQIQQTVSAPWIVRKTLDGRLLFKNKGSKPALWQCEHPDPSFDPSKYKIPEEDAYVSDEAIKYEALSYAWGSEWANDRIWIRSSRIPDSEIQDPLGNAVWKVLSVRSNLVTALRHLRHQTNSRILWIDAVCINQDDPREKSNEVPRIGAIFALAHRVVAFLGPETNSSAHAIQSLRFLGEQVELLALGSAVRCPAPGAIEKRWYRREVDLGYSNNTWNAVLDLLKHEWFRRLWIVQEIAVANHRAIILCGRESMSLSLFRRALTALNGKDWLPSIEARAAIRYAHKMIDVREGLPLRNILDFGDGRHCVDPRDRVYALCGLLAPKFKAKIKVDYTKGIGQVFTQMTRAHIQHLRRLELFGHCYHTCRTLLMPSWVPDLTLQGGLRLDLRQFASGYSRAHFQFLSQNNLQVLGLRCAVIDQVFGPLDKNCEDPIGTIKMWQPTDPASPYPTGETLAIAQAITLRANRFAHRHPGKGRVSLEEWLAELSMQGFWGLQYNFASTNAQSGFSRVINYAKDCTYVHTIEGYVGLAPRDSKIGDIIAVILGADKPVLLRLKENKSFITVGECFVYGLHDATGLLGPLPEPWQLKVMPARGKRSNVTFFNKTTGEESVEDPRLGKLDGWARIARSPDPDDPETCDYFQHEQSGEIVDSDPRMLPEALKDRGVKLSTFNIA